jgi:hypothetical protein
MENLGIHHMLFFNFLLGNLEIILYSLALSPLTALRVFCLSHLRNSSGDEFPSRALLREKRDDRIQVLNNDLLNFGQKMPPFRADATCLWQSPRYWLLFDYGS